MKSYTIRRASGPVALTGEPWAGAAALAIDEFPWYQAGQRQGTTARVLYDDRAVHVQFVCEDRHIFALGRELNGAVCADSCVEFFATVEPDRGPHYFNFEANCCGAMHLGWGPERNGRKLVDAPRAGRIRIATSVPTPTKDESSSDRSWWLAATIPFDVLSEFTGRPIEPRKGTTWRANVDRCGGKTDDQYACWNVVGTPRPDFHQPGFFGELRFG